jgi:competence protein ComEC
MVRDRARVKRFLDDYGKVLAVSFFVIAIGATIFFLYSLTLPKKLHVTFFDVGQGDSILIQTPSGHEVLIDGGATSLVVKKLSKKMGYFDKHLDVMIATHDDADHITGLIPTLARYEVGSVVTSSVDGTSGIDRELDSAVMHEGAQVHVGVQGEYVDFGDGVVLRGVAKLRKLLMESVPA